MAEYELYELDGAFRLVSLRDDSMVRYEASDDDLMEIDEEVANEPDQTRHHEEQDEENDQPQHEIPRDGLVLTLSNSLILSPTSLGARVALRAREPEEYDYEVDTSNYQPEPTRKSGGVFTVAHYTKPASAHFQHASGTQDGANGIRRRNVSSYSAATLDDLLVGAQDSDEPVSAPVLYDNLMNQSYLLRKQMEQISRPPVEVHHHHYYNDNHPGPRATALAPAMGPPRPERGSVDLLPAPWQAGRPHEKIPYLVTTYLQVATNLAAVAYGAHLVWTFAAVVRADIGHKLQRHTSSILVDIDTCRRQYVENRCSPDQIVPALEKQCSAWLKCMRQDPYAGGNKSSISAETVGMILNSLIEPLGPKFWAVAAGLTVVLFVCNFSFGYLRAKSYYGWHAPQS